MRVFGKRWVRLTVATVVFAALLAVVNYMLYGVAALCSVKGILGIVVQTLIFLACMACLLGAEHPASPIEDETTAKMPQDQMPA